VSETTVAGALLACLIVPRDILVLISDSAAPTDDVFVEITTNGIRDFDHIQGRCRHEMSRPVTVATRFVVYVSICTCALSTLPVVLTVDCDLPDYGPPISRCFYHTIGFEKLTI
jgi:hypothetical protein